ncbi:S16 family serine protease [Vulcanisaeta thermophila]|uniref:S16 family serine protease n=1 Tax=Vulcanisaeta thermophila TaxID=867917 RepID=UPI000852EAE6|nr:S16 family serine protease [Vulcanisaeta thermophila]
MRVPKALVVTLIIMMVAGTALAAQWVMVTEYENSTTIHALAVSSNSTGAVINITITAVTPGSGNVYVAANPLPTAESGTFLSSSQIAALVATYLANQSFTRYDFLINVEPTTLEIGGPSASGYMTVAMWALITNHTLNPDVVMTGMILPDGTIGPVGGLPEKIAAAAQEGYEVVLIPYGQQMYQTQSGQVINLISYGKRLGVDVIPVMDVRQAIYYFTGVNMTIPNIPPSELKNDYYMNITKFLWDRIYERLVESGAVNSTDPNVVNYVRQAMNAANDNEYYTAASLGYTALINYYRDELQNYTVPQLRQLVNTLTNELNYYQNVMSSVNTTTANVDIVIGIYDRIQEAQQLLSQAEQDLSSGDITDAISNIAIAKARTETLSDWLSVLNAINGGVPINETALERLSAIYLTYAQSITGYTLSLANAVGVPSSSIGLNTVLQELQQSQNNYQNGLYLLALAQSLDVISTDDVALHELFMPVINGQPTIGYLINITNYVRGLAVYNTYIAENKCDLFPMLSISYIDYGNYFLNQYYTSGDEGDLVTALSLYELAASYSQAIYELARSTSSCGYAYSVGPIYPYNPVFNSSAGFTTVTIGSLGQVNVVNLVIGIVLIVVAIEVAIFSIRGLRR